MFIGELLECIFEDHIVEDLFIMYLSFFILALLVALSPTIHRLTVLLDTISVLTLNTPSYFPPLINHTTLHHTAILDSSDRAAHHHH